MSGAVLLSLAQTHWGELLETNDRAELLRSQLMYDANRKSAGVAYLLLIFLGGFGAHRFYQGKTGTAVGQLALSLLGWLTLMIGVGFLLLAALGIWLIVDLFLVPSIAREQNMALAHGLTDTGDVAYRR